MLFSANYLNVAQDRRLGQDAGYLKITGVACHTNAYRASP